MVAFLDILGFRSFVSGGYPEAVARIKAIDRALEASLRYVREQEQAGWVSIRTFSDCLCLSTEERYLPELIDSVSLLQWDLATSGIFVRGGVSKGYHCETSRMIFSQGLVRAYELHSSDPYPRVMVAPEVAQEMASLSYSRPVCCVGVSVPLPDYLLRDADGVCFVDYLSALGLTELGDFDEHLVDHAGLITQQLVAHRDDAHVLSKFLWLAAYHNFRFGEVFTPDEWEADYFDELRERATVPLNTLTPAEKEAVGRMQFSRMPLRNTSMT